MQMDSCQLENIANLFPWLSFVVLVSETMYSFQTRNDPINHVNGAMNQISTIAKPSQGPDWDEQGEQGSEQHQETVYSLQLAKAF